MTKKVSDELSEMIEDAIDRFRQGDEVQWELGYLGILQAINPQAPAGAYMLAIMMPSIVIGETMQMTVILQQGSTTKQEDIDQMVKAGIEGIREQRTKLLSQPAAEPAGPSGLITAR